MTSYQTLQICLTSQIQLDTGATEVTNTTNHPEKRKRYLPLRTTRPILFTICKPNSSRMISLRTVWTMTKSSYNRRLWRRTMTFWPLSKCKSKNQRSLTMLLTDYSSNNNSLWKNISRWVSPLRICFQMTRCGPPPVIQFRVAWQQTPPKQRKTSGDPVASPSSATSSTPSYSLQWSGNIKA